ncbi:MAG: glutamine amidotransferase [Victivallales bacterium]
MNISLKTLALIFRNGIKAITVAFTFLLGVTALAETVFGPNQAVNPDFENWVEGKPADWTVRANPADSSRISADASSKVNGKTSLKLEIPAKGNANIQTMKVIPVEAGAKYLFSLSYRSEGFGEKGKYSGVDSSARLMWLDGAGKEIYAGGILAFPYHAVPDWDLRDTIATAPDNAAGAIISFGMGNNSEKQSGKTIPSTLWIDAVRLLRYYPPPDPEAAKKKVEKIVEGGWDNSIVKSYDLTSLRHGKFAVIANDSSATDGSCLRALTTEGKGLIAHSPYFTSPRPGLYRAVLRARTDGKDGGTLLGSIGIASENSSSRGGLSIKTGDFSAPGKYQDFSVDFILRASGWWDFVIGTEGTAEWFADTVRVYPLKYFSDREMLEIFPGMEGTVPEKLVPGTTAPCSVLVFAGPYYDYWHIADALHIGQMPITPVFIRGGRNQTFLNFPETAEELFKHRLLVMCDVDIQSLSLKQKKMILEFVSRGGGLILLGGHKAFDRGGVQNSLLADLLPVSFRPSEDMPFAGRGQSATLVKGPAHPTTEFMKMDSKPVCYWWHSAKANDGAAILLSLDKGDPAVVTGTFGKGRVACVLMTCHGDPATGENPFWSWNAWPVFLRDLCWWSTGREDGRFE